ncbi:MAG: Crp/Fnr family transcriptional regulator [Nitrospinales bacterium]
MNQDQIVKKLDELSFFNDLNNDEKNEIATLNGYLLQFEPFVKIVNEGEIDRAFYIILEGKVSLTKNKPPEITVAQLVPGSIFGDITLRGQRPRANSVSSDDNIVILKIDKELINNVLNPVLANKIKDQVIDLLVRRLDEMNNKLVGFVR